MIKAVNTKYFVFTAIFISAKENDIDANFFES